MDITKLDEEQKARAIRYNESAKAAFFNIVGITNPEPYTAMGIRGTIHTLQNAAELSLALIGRANDVTGEAVHYHIARARVHKDGIPIHAIWLAEAMAPLLAQAVAEQRILPGSFTKNPHAAAVGLTVEENRTHYR